MATAQNNRKVLNIALWAAQIILALVFLMAGFSKSSQPIEELGKMLPWVTEVPVALVRFIGVSELLGGVGLLLPAALRIKPNLTPLAALALAIVMVFALVFHILKGEYSALGINIAFGAIAYFIYWGRTKKVPITAKS